MPSTWFRYEYPVPGTVGMQWTGKHLVWHLRSHSANPCMQCRCILCYPSSGLFITHFQKGLPRYWVYFISLNQMRLLTLYRGGSKVFYRSIPPPPQIPKARKSQRITTMITTILSIDLIVDCIGMYLLISHSIRPTTTRTMITLMIDIDNNLIENVWCKEWALLNSTVSLKRWSIK